VKEKIFKKPGCGTDFCRGKEPVKKSPPILENSFRTKARRKNRQTLKEKRKCVYKIRLPVYTHTFTVFKERWKVIPLEKKME